MTDDPTVPPVGLYRTPDHRYYWNGMGPFPSTTTVLGIIDKPALVAWAKRETAECAIRNFDLLDGMRRTGGDRMAVEWLKGIPDYQRDSAADRGTRVHAAADAYNSGGDINLEPEEMPYLDAYRRWLDESGARILAGEFAVIGHVDADNAYGGTGDLLAYLDDDLWLIDLKTSRSTYKETALQLASYGFASFAGYPNDPQPYRLPTPDRYGVLHIRPELYPDSGGYRLIEYDVDEDTFAAFCDAYRLRRWLTGPNPQRKGTDHGS